MKIWDFLLGNLINFNSDLMEKNRDRFEIAIKSQHFRFNSAHFLTHPAEPLHGHNYRVKIKLIGLILQLFF